jgi:hypothetical protein
VPGRVGKADEASSGRADEETAADDETGYPVPG